MVSRFVFSFSLILSLQLSIAQAPVPVVKEPFHKVIFSNDYIRILDVHIRAGDTTLYHIHKTNSAIVFLSSNKTGSQVLGGKPVRGKAVQGNTSYANFGDSPVTHRVWNEDTAMYHVYDIELIGHPRGWTGAVLTNPGLSLAWEKKLARAYRLRLEAGQDFEIKGSEHPHLLIWISGSAKPLREGKRFGWYPAGTGFICSARGNVAAEYVLLELN